MKPKLFSALFVFVFTCCFQVEFRIPPRPYLIVSGICVTMGLVGLVITSRMPDDVH